MPRAVPRSSRRAKAQTALDVLKDDHAQVSKLFKQFEHFHKSDDGDGMQRCAQAACSALRIHAQIEEEIFYPALRQSADAEDALDEADVEHSHIKALVGEVEGAGHGDEHFEARVKVLSEYVRHHVEEEESTIFSKARKANCDLVALGLELVARKQELGGGEASADVAAALAARAPTARPRNGQRVAR